MSASVRQSGSPAARQSLSPILCAGLGILLLAGCAEERQPPQKPGAPQVGFRPDQFPDIPLPRSGFMPDPTRDQLALAVAGGMVRRFDVSLIQREHAASQPSAELLSWYRRDLELAGWTLAEDGDGIQRWRKGTETLSLETGRSGGRTTIRLRLRPDR